PPSTSVQEPLTGSVDIAAPSVARAGAFEFGSSHVPVTTTVPPTATTAEFHVLLTASGIPASCSQLPASGTSRNAGVPLSGSDARPTTMNEPPTHAAPKTCS